MTNTTFRNIMIGLVGTAILLAGVAFYLMYPAQYLALDVNPSIEMQTNRLGRVVSMVGVNEDARTLLTDYQASGQKLDKVLEQIVNRMVENGYVSAEKMNDILVTSVKGAMSDKDLLQISEKIQQELAKHQLSGEIVTQTITLDKNTEQNAAQNEVSAGKMAVIEKLTGKDLSLTAEELANMRIGDLLTYAEKNNISLDTLEDHLENLQSNGGENAHLEDLEESVDDAKDADGKEESDEQAEEKAEKEADAAKESDEKAKELAEDQAEQAEEKAEKEADAAKESAEKAKELAEDQAEQAEEKAEKEADAAKESDEKAKELAEDQAEQAEEKAEKEADAAKESAEKAKELAEDQAEQAKEKAEKEADAAKESDKKAKDQAKQTKKASNVTTSNIEDKANEEADVKETEEAEADEEEEADTDVDMDDAADD